MSALHDFAEFFKSRKTRIRTWYEDGVGKWAFRVVVDGQAFVCCARKVAPTGGKTSVMKRVAGRAQSSDAYVAVRLPDDDIHVFDPVAILAEGEPDDVVEDDRRERGEEWVTVPLSLSVRFGDWYDGIASPAEYTGVDSFT